MMSSPFSSTLAEQLEYVLRPGVEGWELWQVQQAEPKQIPLTGQTNDFSLPKNTALALPLRDCLVLPLHLPKEDLLAALPLELESKGLFTAGSTENFTAHIIPTLQEQQDLGLQNVFVAILLDSALELARNLQLSVALPSAYFLDLPANTLSLWKEENNIVCALTQQQTLVHAQVLGCADFDLACYRELIPILATFSLQPKQIKCHFYHKEATSPSWAKEHFLSTEVTDTLPAPTLTPQIQQTHLPVLPHYAEKTQVSKRNRQLGLIAAIVLLLAFGWLGFRAFSWIKLNQHQQKLAQEIEENTPRATMLAATDKQWNEVIVPLFQEAQPLEYILAIQQLSPEGVIWEQISIQPQSLEIRGFANSATPVLELQQRLETSSLFSDWIWENQSPNIDAEGRAEFRFQATRTIP